mmetsp:Transcript_6288/g.12486  ORF Transcript_6288/g.12486 Transcript_6288/m.12486 type:complete len:80 (+) Transcript_6288:749-988(+)
MKVILKEVRISPTIAAHDLAFKVKKALAFLEVQRNTLLIHSICARSCLHSLSFVMDMNPGWLSCEDLHDISKGSVISSV